MNKSLLIYIYTIIFLVYNPTYSSDKTTNFSIIGGIYLNKNLYFSDFSNLPGIPFCCTNFNYATGYKEAYTIGGEYKGFRFFYNLPAKYSVLLTYSDLSANYEVSEFIGNNIDGNKVERIISQYRLNPNIRMIGIEQYLSVKPMDYDHIPFWIDGGIILGLPIKTEFTQEEALISPDNITFENLERTRSVASGKIPNASSFYFSLSIGLGWELYHTRNFEFIAEAKQSYNFTNIVSSLDWKAHSLRVGLKFRYNIPAAEPPAPVPPPKPYLPPPPLPPAPDRLAVSVKIGYNNDIVEDGGIIPVKIETKVFKEYYSMQPVLYFEKNSIKLIESNLQNEYFKYLPNNIFVNLIDYLNNYPDSRLSLNVYQPSDEEKSVIDSRIEFFKETLINNSIDLKRLENINIIPQNGKLSYEELNDERRKIEIKLGNGQNLVPITNSFKTENYLDGIKLLIKPEITAEAGLESSHLIVSSCGKDFPELTVESSELIITPEKIIAALDNKDCEKYTVTSEIKDKNEKIAIAHSSFIVSPVRQYTEYINTKIDNSNIAFSQYIIGYCNFDESDFSVVDNKVIEIVRSEAAQGKKIEIIGLTDNLGTGEHNSRLAMLRAKAAEKLIGSYDNIEIIIPDNYVFPNNSPIGRQMNRSVIVRIR